MKRKIDDEVAEWLKEAEEFGKDLHNQVNTAKTIVDKLAKKKATMPASGPELDEALPDLSPGVS